VIPALRAPSAIALTMPWYENRPVEHDGLYALFEKSLSDFLAELGAAFDVWLCP
jgi:hypothetical protein